MELGLRPVVYEPTRVGGRLRSHEFEGSKGIVAELGGMRFPISGTSFFHYVNRVGLSTVPFPNPLTEAAGTTVVDMGGRAFQGRTLGDLPWEYTEIAMAWDEARGLVAVVYRSPARLVLLDSASGRVKETLDSCGDADDVFFDTKRQRIYVSCGSGSVDVFQETAGRY